MNNIELTEKEKSRLFWASFLALAAAGFGFSFRIAFGKTYGIELGLTNAEVGQIFGASLWPIALTMIGFSLIVDKIGYKIPMYIALTLQAISAIGTCFAGSYDQLYIFAILAGLGHGIVEAVINPVCAAIYPQEKTKRLTILHASWPAGIVLGTFLNIQTESFIGWGGQSLWMLIPIIAYGILFTGCRFPIDQRVQAGVPYLTMLKQIGFLAAFIAIFLITQEVGNLKTGGKMAITNSLIIALILAGAFGVAVKSFGKPLFFLLCLLMIPVATAEISTDQWIKPLMNPVLEQININPGYAIIFSAFIMMIFRIFAGGVLKKASPPTIMAISGLFSAIGLIWLSNANGASIFFAFVLYALGQTYYWPCILGFVSERYPEGGALTLNTVSAIGLLSAGIVGGQLLGTSFDKRIHEQTSIQLPSFAKSAESHDKKIFGVSYSSLDGTKTAELLKKDNNSEDSKKFKAIDKESGRYVLTVAAIFPLILVIAFGFITFYFRSRGGYKPVELTKYKE